MKITEIIFEANMSPTGIAQLAAKAGAVCGVEFEMIVPEGILTPKSSKKKSYPKPESFEHIFEFFEDHGSHSPAEVREAVTYMKNEFEAFMDSRFESKGNDFKKWAAKNPELLRDKVDFFTEALEIDKVPESEQSILISAFKKKLGLKPGELTDAERNAQKFVGQYLSDTEERWDQFLDDVWDEADPSGPVYKFEKLFRANNYQPLFDEWMADNGFVTMQDFVGEYQGLNLREQDTSFDLSKLAEEFEDVVDERVISSEKYHGSFRDGRSWFIEPDTSIEANSDEHGLEFISPPLKLDVALEKMKKVQDWANSMGCMTDTSTGLHMNLSIPGVNYNKIDLVKLVMFLGDEYILKQFGRTYNSYCKSTLKVISATASKTPGRSKEVLTAMRTSLEKAARMLVFDNQKYRSVHPHDDKGYVEFRSPGGDWLNEDFNTLANTMKRFAAAMFIAAHPELYREEYLKKMYKLLEPGTGPNQFTTLFAQYAAKQIGISQLSSRLQMQKQARLNKKPQQDSEANENYQIVHNTTGDIITYFTSKPADAMRRAVLFTRSLGHDIDRYSLKDQQGNFTQLKAA